MDYRIDKNPRVGENLNYFQQKLKNLLQPSTILTLKMKQQLNTLNLFPDI